MFEVRGLSHTYGKFRALHDVTFTMQRRDFIGLIGPNGAGKTTLLNIMTGILAPTEGTVTLNDTPVLGFRPEVRRQIGYMPSELSTYELFSPLELVQFLGAMYDIPKQELTARVETLFTALEITDWKHKSIKKLSTGMKKKVAFTAAVLHEPDILILDEPFESVDPISQHTMKGLLEDMRDAGCSILMSSHILDQVQNLCDTYILLNAGEILRIFQTDELQDTSLEAEFISMIRQLKDSEEDQEEASDD